MNDELRRLIGLAESAMAVVEAEDFIARSDEYLAELDGWQKRLAANGGAASEDEDKALLRRLAQRLGELHQELITRAEREKQALGSAMGELHRRSVGLKKYVDTYPSRITIAGTRKG